MEINDIDCFTKLQEGQTGWNFRKKLGIQQQNRSQRKYYHWKLEMFKRKFTFQHIQNE